MVRLARDWRHCFELAGIQPPTRIGNGTQDEAKLFKASHDFDRGTIDTAGFIDAVQSHLPDLENQQVLDVFVVGAGVGKETKTQVNRESTALNKIFRLALGRTPTAEERQKVMPW